MNETLYFTVTICLGLSPCDYGIHVSADELTWRQCVELLPRDDGKHQSFCVPYTKESPMSWQGERERLK